MLESLESRVFPDRKHLSLSFDARRLEADLAILRDTPWTRHFVHSNYQGDWSAIALRAPAGETHPIRLISAGPAKGWVNTPLLAAMPAIQAALARIAAPKLSVRLMRLGPGSCILPHGDLDLAAELGKARLHLPIVTNPDVRFVLNGELVPMAPGELWYLRLSDRHEATNDGTSDRIHLVVDVEVNDWLAALIAD